jgi:septum formation protein
MIQGCHFPPESMTVIYLASRSPRRRELLTQLGVAHDVLLFAPAAPGVDDEPQLPGEAAADYVRRTARDKAWQGARVLAQRQLPLRPVLAADTTVILNGQVLGKPRDRDDALSMLRRLSGATHQVHTALALVDGDRLREDVSITDVVFDTLSDAQIAAYCDSGDPYDKAGAYGIQSGAGRFVSRIAGSFTGVMGLPLFETARLLAQLDNREHS